MYTKDHQNKWNTKQIEHQNKWYIKYGTSKQMEHLKNGTSKQSTFPLCYQIMYYIDPNKTNLFP